MEYEDRLTKLKRLTLKTRRLFLSLIECPKIVFGISKLNFDDLFEFTKCNSTRANHPYKSSLRSSRFRVLQAKQGKRARALGEKGAKKKGRGRKGFLHVPWPLSQSNRFYNDPVFNDC